MTDDIRLIEGLKKQKRGSLETAIDIYTPYVSVIVYNIIGQVMTKEDVEEVVSDVFVLLWRNAKMLDLNKGSVRSYLGTIAKNAAKKKLRSVSAEAPLDESSFASMLSPEERAEKKEEMKKLLELIDSLGEPDSEIFLRRYWYGERVSKISAATGICKSTITTKLQRGRKKLKEILTKEVRQ